MARIVGFYGSYLAVRHGGTLYRVAHSDWMRALAEARESGCRTTLQATGLVLREFETTFLVLGRTRPE